MPVCGAFYFLYTYSKIIKLIVQARTFLTLVTWYNKKVPDRLIIMNLPRTDKILLSAVPPCFPFQGSFYDTSISLATNVCAHVMEYLAYAFDHTLSGPFNKLLSVWFSASQTLCTAHFLFLSPLQRFEVLLCYLIIALLYNAFFHLSSRHFLFFF